MYISLLVVGLLLVVSGLATVAFGIPINAFSLGNTLIIAGTVATTGGFVLVGLAFAVRQLSQVHAALLSFRQPVRPAQPAAPQPGTAAHAPQPPAPPPSGTPARPAAPRLAEATRPRLPELRMPEPRAVEASIPVEPRVAAAAQNQARPPLDWLRPRAGAVAAPAASEPPLVELSDEAPLSPRTPPRPALSPLATMAEPLQEPRAWAPRPKEPAESGSELRVGRSGADRIARLSGRKEPRLYEAAWPKSRWPRAEQPRTDEEPAKPAEDLAKSAEEAAHEDAPRPVEAEAPRPAETVETVEPAEAKSPDSEASETSKVEESAKPESAEAPVEPAADAPTAPEVVEAPETREPAAVEEPREAEGATASDEAPTQVQLESASEQPVAVLKSGVIDGMAYTLYADGSIEAELPQEGTVRFGSVDALRTHLEKAV